MDLDALSVRDIYGSDPLAHLLLGRWRLRPWVIALISLLVGVCYMGGLAAAFGYFRPRPGIVASQSDIFNQLNFFIVFPVVMFYYLWQPAKIVQVYDAVCYHVQARDETAVSLLQAIRRLNAHPGWWLPGVFVCLLGMTVGVYDSFSRLGIWWYTANWLMAAVLQLVRGIIFYALIVVVARHLATTVGLNRLYARFPIPVRVLPITHAGGIQTVGQYAFSFTAAAAVVGINLGTVPILSTRIAVDYPFQVLAYFLLAPLGFFLPLLQAHSHMAQNRNRVLDGLAAQFQAEYTRLLRLVADNDQEAAESLARLKIIQETYEWTRKSPTWPFDTSTLYRLGATIVAPFSFALLQIVLELLAR